MSGQESKGPYVYQPYGLQDKARVECGRIYGVSGIDSAGMVQIKGLTKSEAQMVRAVLDQGK